MGEGVRVRWGSPASALLLVAVTALVLAACGLEDTPVPYPPGKPDPPASPGTPVFSVIYNVTTLPEFRGFEVYYKFFSTDQPLQDGLKSLAELQAAEFHRMCSPGTIYDQGLPYIPLIPVDPLDRGADFTTELDFWLTFPPFFVYPAANPPPYSGLRRTATDILGETETFELGELDPTDVDLTDVNWTQIGNDQILNLVVYAISYGLQMPSTPLWSDEAIYLGYMSYIIF